MLHLPSAILIVFFGRFQTQFSALCRCGRCSPAAIVIPRQRSLCNSRIVVVQAIFIYVSVLLILAKKLCQLLYSLISGRSGLPGKYLLHSAKRNSRQFSNRLIGVPQLDLPGLHFLNCHRYHLLHTTKFSDDTHWNLIIALARLIFNRYIFHFWNFIGCIFRSFIDNKRKYDQLLLQRLYHILLQFFQIEPC